MRTATSDRTKSPTLLAFCYGVPVEDVLPIAVLVLGIASGEQRHRERVIISLVPHLRWLVPLRGSTLTRLAAGAYAMAPGVETFNLNARSRRTGSTSCPHPLGFPHRPKLAHSALRGQ